LIIPLVSPARIIDSEIINNDYHFYVNDSNFEEIVITSTEVTFKNALAESILTNLNGETIVKLIGLTDPYNDIEYGNANNLMRNVINSNIAILLGEKVKIFNSPVSSGGDGGGGGTIFVPIVLNNFTIQYPDWIKGKENQVYIFVRDINENLVDIDLVEIDILDLQNYEYTKNVSRVRTGTYKGNFLIKSDIDSIRLNVTVKEKAKIISRIVEIEINEETFENKLKSETQNKKIKLISFLEDKTVRVVFICFLCILFSVSFFWVLWKRRKKDKV